MSDKISVNSGVKVIEVNDAGETISLPLGDQKSGTNIETPLSTMADAFKQALAESGGGTTTVIVKLDGKEVARNTVKHVNDMTRAAGKPVLLY